MKSIQERLLLTQNKIADNNVSVMIIGLGSVGTYFLDYLVSTNDPAIKVIVVGRNKEKIERNVNIVRISSLIRELNKTEIVIESGIDLEDVESIQRVISKHNPTFIINSSRAYSGLKYGSISWRNVRAYGIWTPLSIRYVKNIMEACNQADADAIVINTSYSDAVIPWLKSAGMPYPDLGSGNINHLIPRIKYAVSERLGIRDFWNVDVILAAGHFHDVCISKEGHSEGIKLPLKIFYKGKELFLNEEELFRNCKIAMPVDSQRNMMNASSNYQIIDAIIKTVRTKECKRIFSPGFLGNIGGYPVCVGYKNEKLDLFIDETFFSFDEMNCANRKSMYLDGIEDIRDGDLIYTDELIEKTKKAFGVNLPKKVNYSGIEEMAEWIIREIINPQLKIV